MPVDVFPFYRSIGYEVSPVTSDKFIDLVITDCDADEATELIRSEERDRPEDFTGHIRLWRVFVDELPAGMLNAINSTGEAEASREQLRGWIRRVDTDEEW